MNLSNISVQKKKSPRSRQQLEQDIFQQIALDLIVHLSIQLM